MAEDGTCTCKTGYLSLSPTTDCVGITFLNKIVIFKINKYIL